MGRLTVCPVCESVTSDEQACPQCAACLRCEGDAGAACLCGDALHPGAPGRRCQVDGAALRKAWRPLQVARLYQRETVSLTVQDGWLFLASPRATTSLPCISEGPMTASVPGQRFGQLVDRLPADTITFTDDGGDLLVQAAGGTFRFYSPAHRGDSAKAWRQARGLSDGARF